jgi:hypothetical protein
MKKISYDGVAAVTTDDVAEALLELAMAVARYRVYETVTVPVVVDGMSEELTLMLGPTIHLSALTVPSAARPQVEGADAAARSIRRRARTLVDPLHAPQGDRSPE